MLKKQLIYTAAIIAFVFCNAVTFNAQAQAISVGVVNSKAVSLPQPVNPGNLSGTVNVKVEIDAQGNVVSAQAVSGNQALRSAAEDAARRAKFKPTILSGKSVPVSGVVVFNFSGNGRTVSAPTQTNSTKVPSVTKEKLIGGLKMLREKPANEEDRLEKEKFTKVLPKYIETYGVDFRLTPEIEKELRSAGASNLIIEAVRNTYRGDSFDSSVDNSPKTSTSNSYNTGMETGKYSCGVYLSFFTLTQYITLNGDGTYIVLKTDGKTKTGNGKYSYDSDSSQIKFSGYLSDWVGRPKKDTQFYLTQKADLDKSEYDQNRRSHTCTLSRK